MKLRRPELAILSVTLLALAVMGGFFAGRNSVAGPVRIITRSSAQASLPAQVRASDGGLPAQTEQPEDSGGAAAGPVNINTATAEELQALPGIGPTRAKAIVAYREEHGPFVYPEDLRKVSGIGEGTLAKLLDHITVGEQSNGETFSGGR